MTFQVKQKLRVIVLVHEDLVPPETLDGANDKDRQAWRTEYDVISTLKSLGHDVRPIGLSNDLSVVRGRMQTMLWQGDCKVGGWNKHDFYLSKFLVIDDERWPLGLCFEQPSHPTQATVVTDRPHLRKGV